MNTIWKVSHHLSQTIEYGSGPTAYPNVGVNLILEDGKFIRIDHEFCGETAMSDDAAIALSLIELATLLELLRYRWGYPVVPSRQTATKGSGGASTTNRATISGRSAIVHRVRLPNETVLAAPNRLRVWLRLANEARQPTPVGDAIRYYYMIWEDMYGEPTTPESRELKFIRHFVSHGGVLGDPNLCQFLGTEIGKPTNQYDPHDPDHQNFLERSRDWARLLVEAEIEKYL